MIKEINELNNKVVEIADFQTTYIVLKADNKLYHFDFRNKKEFCLKSKETGTLKFYNNHPLLINHNEDLYEIFLSSRPKDENIFIKNIEEIIAESTMGWRTWKDYIELDTGVTYEIFLGNLKKGSGKLMKFPFSIFEKFKYYCEINDIKISFFEHKAASRCSLIFINNQFVIAEQFKLKTKL